MNGVCRVCGETLSAFMSFGDMPSANGFLTPAQIHLETFFEMRPAVCDNCGTFQLVDGPAPTEMFHDNYVYFSRQSAGMVRHFAEYATKPLMSLIGRSMSDRSSESAGIRGISR